MNVIENANEKKILRQGGKILAAILEALSQETKIGVSTAYLNARAEKLIVEAGVKPAFLNYEGYPATLCTSINEEIVHCLPSERVLKTGDILSLDLGIF